MPSCSCRRRSLGSGMPSSIAAAAGLVMPLILPLVQQDQDNNWLTETAGQPACRSLTAGDLIPAGRLSPEGEEPCHHSGQVTRTVGVQPTHVAIERVTPPWRPVLPGAGALGIEPHRERGGHPNAM